MTPTQAYRIYLETTSMMVNPPSYEEWRQQQLEEDEEIQLLMDRDMGD